MLPCLFLWFKLWGASVSAAGFRGIRDEEKNAKPPRADAAAPILSHPALAQSGDADVRPSAAYGGAGNRRARAPDQHFRQVGGHFRRRPHSPGDHGVQQQQGEQCEAPTGPGPVHQAEEQPAEEDCGFAPCSGPAGAYQHAPGTQIPHRGVQPSRCAPSPHLLLHL